MAKKKRIECKCENKQAFDTEDLEIVKDHYGTYVMLCPKCSLIIDYGECDKK